MLRQDFLSRAVAVDNLPSLPAVAIEVLALSKNPNATADDLTRIVQNDPAITGRLLKIVNSALFGVPRKVGSVKQAISMMGVRSVTVTVLTFALVESLKNQPIEGLDIESHWRRSLSSAVAARLLARAVNKSIADEAFVVGLLSDVGIMAAWQGCYKEYAPVVARSRAESRPLHELEREILGVDHATISAALLRTWGLPDRICDAVETHHNTGVDDQTEGGSRLSPVATQAAALSAIFCGDMPSEQLMHTKAACVSALGIDAGELEKILSELSHGVIEASRALSVEVGATVNYDQLKADAATRLAGLSLEADVQRAEAIERQQAAQTDAAWLQSENFRILEVASSDALTGLANRAAFDKRIAELLPQTRGAGLSMALLFLDVDHFKMFNDTYGHQAGDEALRCVGKCLAQITRHDGFSARYGGEEFVSLIVGKSDQEVRQFAESIRDSIARMRVRFKQSELLLTVSVGVAQSERWPDTTTPEQVIRLADEQLYKAKHSGRNRVEFGVFAEGLPPRGANSSAAA